MIKLINRKQAVPCLSVPNLSGTSIEARRFVLYKSASFHIISQVSRITKIHQPPQLTGAPECFHFLSRAYMTTALPPTEVLFTISNKFVATTNSPSLR